MTLLDVAMAHAARSPGEDGVAERSGVVTIEMKTSFMRPGLGRLVATGRRPAPHGVVRVLRGLGGRHRRKLLAHSTGTFKFLKGLPAGGKRIQRIEASD
jgi:acyl-coenzyme A thioesterase PaaI-like protein